MLPEVSKGVTIAVSSLPIFNVKSLAVCNILYENDVIWNVCNKKNQTPLTIACQGGYLDVVEFFMLNELDIHHLDVDRKTPFIYAQENNHSHILEWLKNKLLI